MGNLTEYVLNNYNKYRKEILIHCNDGRGVSGTFLSILAESIMLHSETKRKAASIFNTVTWIRQYRKGLVETIEQYEFIFRYVELFKNNRKLSFRDITPQQLV